MLSIVSVVIDNLEIVGRFVSSVKQYTTTKFELILIDNASKVKDSIRYFKEIADVYFRFDTITDLSKAWNKGISLSEGDHVAIVNNDVVVPPNWFEPLKETLDNNENAGMVSPITYWLIKDGYFKCNAFKNFDKTFSKPFKLEKFKEVVWGEFCVFKKQALTDVNGYCELYKKFGAEDLEICFQLYTKNYEIYIDPRVFVYHEGHATLNTLIKEEAEKINNDNFKLFKSRWSKYAGDWE